MGRRTIVLETPSRSPAVSTEPYFAFANPYNGQ